MNYTSADYAALAAGPASTSLWIWVLLAAAAGAAVAGLWAWRTRRAAGYWWLLGGLLAGPAIVGYVAGAWPRAYPALVSSLVQVAVLGAAVWLYRVFKR